MQPGAALTNVLGPEVTYVAPQPETMQVNLAEQVSILCAF